MDNSVENSNGRKSFRSTRARGQDLSVFTQTQGRPQTQEEKVARRLTRWKLASRLLHIFHAMSRRSCHLPRFQSHLISCAPKSANFRVAPLSHSGLTWTSLGVTLLRLVTISRAVGAAIGRCWIRTTARALLSSSATRCTAGAPCLPGRPAAMNWGGANKRWGHEYEPAGLFTIRLFN